MNGNTQGTAPIRLVSAATSAFESTAVRLELARDRSAGRGAMRLLRYGWREACGWHDDGVEHGP